MQVKSIPRVCVIGLGGVGLHANSEPLLPYHLQQTFSSFTADASSSLPTARVWGAFFSWSGSFFSSSAIWFIAATKASSVSLLSVSVGSIRKHYGTSSGK